MPAEPVAYGRLAADEQDQGGGDQLKVLVLVHLSLNKHHSVQHLS